MEKLLKRVVSVICALAMVVTGLTFAPANVDASTEVVSGVDTSVGAWHLKATNEEWAGYSRLSYDSTGDALGATTLHLINSPEGTWNDVEYGMYARLKHYSANKMDADCTYRLAVTINASKTGILLTQIEGKEYEIPVTKNGATTVYSDYFDHDEFAALTEEQKAWDPNLSIDDVTFFLGQFPKNTDITISKVEFEPLEDPEWTPVPNWNPDEHSSTDVAPYTNAGQLDLLAMYGVESKMYGKMKYKVENEGKNLSDTTVLVSKSSGWENWSTTIRITNWLEKKGYAAGDYYNGEIIIRSNKDTGVDKEGERKQIRCTVCGNDYYTKLDAGVDNKIEIKNMKYVAGKPDISFDVDVVDPGTEITITKAEFTNVDGDEWETVPNAVQTKAGAWNLFARTGDTIEEGQWGALSYKFNSTPATAVGDTTIKVRSASGWYDAWACMGILPDFIKGKLEEGHTYKPVITYHSNMATGTDDSGDRKQVLMSVDKNNLYFPLEECAAGHDETVTLKEFTFEKRNTEGTYDVVFNFEMVDPRTELTIKSIDFVEYNPENWQVVPNQVYTKIGSTDMDLYAEYDSDLKSWSKTSYKFDNPSITDDYTKVTIKTRTTTGWWKPYEPTSVARFRNMGMKPANKYKAIVTLTSDRSDEIKAKDGSSEESRNYLKVISGDDELQQEFSKNPLPDGEEVTFETDYFTYKGSTDKQDSILLSFDSFTENSTVKVKEVKVVRDSSEPEWTKLTNNTATKVGKWTLFANFDAPSEAWGEMFYNETPAAEMGDTTMFCYSTSGWFAPASSIKATLNNYTKNDVPLDAGKNYSAHITIKSDKDCNGVDKEGKENGIKVTIDNSDYIIPIYEGTFTYVIPRLNKVYQNQGKDNVVFNFDKLTAETKINISDVDFKNPIDEPVEISSVNATVNSNSTVKVAWEQTPNTVYGTTTTTGGFNVYVDDKKVNDNVLPGSIREFTTGKLSAGDHKITVKAVLGASVSTGLEKIVTISDTTTQAPTEVTTEAPTEKPTVTPVTTKAPTPTKETTKETTKKVKKPGKVTVKKAVKKKKSAKKIKVTLKKVKNAKGYQIAVYKTKKNAKKNKKALVKKIVKKTKATIKSKKLKGKKTVYVRARAYALKGKKKLFGAWGKVKKSKKK